MNEAHHVWTIVTVAALAMVTVACAKKVAQAPPPPPGPAVNHVPAPQRTSPLQRAVSTPVAVATAAETRYPNAVTRARINDLLGRIEDAYFDYDKASLRADAQKALRDDSTELRDILKDYPDYRLTIEGHCDERGSAEYNLGLGDKRATASKAYLVEIGIPTEQLNLVSFGKERPVCREHDETCWQRNRRIHIVALARAN
ncbi:MAG: OmpA family protein [Bryobacteraceae bacterium]